MCTPSCNTVGVSHAVVGCWRPALVPLQEALKKAKTSVRATSCRPGFGFRGVCGQEEETFGGSRSHEASRCSQSRGSGREGKTRKQNLPERRQPHLPVPTDGLATRLAHLKARLGCRRGGTRCSFTEFIEKTSYTAPNQRGSHTDRPHSSNAVSIDNPISGKPSNWVAIHIHVVRRFRDCCAHSFKEARGSVKPRTQVAAGGSAFSLQCQTTTRRMQVRAWRR